MSKTAPSARAFGVPVLEDLPDPAGKKVLLRATLDLPLSADPSTSLAYVRARRLTASIRWLVERGATVTVWGRAADTDGVSPVRVSRHASPSVLSEFRHVLGALDPSLAQSPSVVAAACIEDEGDVAAEVAKHDLFVNDTLQDSRWPTPSVVVPPDRLPSAAGRSLEEDLAALEPFVTNPERPFVAVLGGERTIERLVGLTGLVLRADAVLLGGGLALPMLQALGRVPSEGKDDDFLWECRRVMGLAQRVRHRLVVPDDLTWSTPDPTPAFPAHGKRPAEVVDIGPAARLRFGQELAGAGAVLWAGSVGRVEEESSRAGTRALAQSLRANEKNSVLLGGDALVDLLEREDLAPPHARVLTATDSAIELLKNGDLPALSAMRDGARDAAGPRDAARARS